MQKQTSTGEVVLALHCPLFLPQFILWDKLKKFFSFIMCKVKRPDLFLTKNSDKKIEVCFYLFQYWNCIIGSV